MSLLAALAVAACGGAARPNVLLVTLDTTRADHLGAYGYPQATSPNLDRLAAEGVLFERAYSHVPITLPSHTSILTGTLPLWTGMRDNGRFVARGELVTLAELLAAEGYQTAAFVSAFVLDSRFGMDQGFDVYDDDYSAEWSEEDLRQARVYNQMITERAADQTAERALAWLARAREPFFLWVHFYDPHQRYDPPPPYGQRFPTAPYDGEIAFMDDHVGRIFEALRKGRRWEGTIVVATGDHGEGLGEHGESTHAVLVYDSTLHVPLIVKPHASFGGTPRRIGDAVGHVDILPTLLPMLGVDPPQPLHGRSLVPELRGETGRQRPIYFETDLPRFGFGWEPLFGVRSEGWKYIHGPQRELYDLGRDPGELLNAAAGETEQRQRLEELLFSIVEAGSAPPEVLRGGSMDAETRQKLAALGYVSAGAATGEAELNPRTPTGRRSPRDGVRHLQEYYAATSLVAAGRLTEAAALYETSLLRFDPRNLAFLTGLAEIRRQLGDVDAAYTLYRRALEVESRDPSLLVELGQLELDRGKAEAAQALFLAALELAPEDLRALYFAAQSAADLGQHAEAVERYRRLLELDPSHLDTLINLGVELARAGRLDEGRAQLQTALRYSPFSSRAHHHLGLLELRAGRPEEAVPGLERALRYRPAYPSARLALGMALVESGGIERGRAELETVVANAPDTSIAESAKAVLASLAEGRRAPSGNP